MSQAEHSVALPADEYRITKLSEADRHDAVALMKRSLGDDSAAAKTEAYWAWKHEESVFGSSYVTGARASDGSLGSLRVMMRWYFANPRGERAVGVRPVDTATHPDHQRRGLFKRLTLAAIEDLTKEGAAFVFNTPNENSRPGYLKMGWSVVADWPLYARPASPLALLPAKKGSANQVQTWLDFKRSHEEAIRRLVEKNEGGRRSTGWRTIRTPEYFSWRYGDLPSPDYHVAFERGEQGLTGFVVGRYTRGLGGLRAFVITEAIVSEPSPGAYHRLFRVAARKVSAVYLIAHFSADTMELGGLRRAGFVRMPRRGYVFTARSLDASKNPDPLFDTSWDLTISELELF